MQNNEYISKNYDQNERVPAGDDNKTFVDFLFHRLHLLSFSQQFFGRASAHELLRLTRTEAVFERFKIQEPIGGFVQRIPQMLELPNVEIRIHLPNQIEKRSPADHSLRFRGHRFFVGPSSLHDGGINVEDMLYYGT